MKTVLQLKKLMYLDPVPRADLYKLTATKGLVSNRIRKKVNASLQSRHRTGERAGQDGQAGG
jgi:hypothetical protein